MKNPKPAILLAKLDALHRVSKMVFQPTFFRALRRVLEQQVPPITSCPLVDKTLAEVEKDHIMRVLEKHGGQRVPTAISLGIGERTLYRKLLAWRES